MPSTFTRPFGLPPGVRMTDRGRYQAYANYVDTAGLKRFRSLGTYDTIARAVGARAMFHLVQRGDAPLIALMMVDSTYSA